MRGIRNVFKDFLISIMSNFYAIQNAYTQIAFEKPLRNGVKEDFALMEFLCKHQELQFYTILSTKTFHKTFG